MAENRKSSKCYRCDGCISCQDVNCIFHSNGNHEECFPEKCMYCKLFLQKRRLYLNNIG